MITTVHYRKTLLVLVLVFSLLTSIYLSPSIASASNNNDVNAFTEEDSMNFVEQCNIDIPDEFLQHEDLPSFTQSLIIQSFNNPNTPFCFNYGVTQKYAEDIRTAVRTYCNLAVVPQIASTEDYSLQYNTVMDENGNWVTRGGYFNEKWWHYNCYAYSINRAERPNFYPTDNYVQYEPGDLSGEGHFWQTTTIEELALLVKYDLLATGFTNISLSTTIPTITSSQELICVRRHLWMDYHFMRYDIETNAWYHKPGNTAVLKYNEIPSNDTIWYSEISSPDGEEEWDSFYDSDIIFITYDRNQINANTDVTATIDIQAEKDVFYELNFTNSGTYQINLDSEYPISYEIYNDNFDVIILGYGTSNTYHSIDFDAGKYYLRMNFESYENTHHVDVSIHKHSYTTYDSLSETQHKVLCGCGNSVNVEEHYAYRYTRTSSTEHNVYCECGYFIRSENHTIVEDSIRYSHCIECGAVFDKFSDVTIKEYEKNEEIK